MVLLVSTHIVMWLYQTYEMSTSIENYNRLSCPWFNCSLLTIFPRLYFSCRLFEPIKGIVNYFNSGRICVLINGGNNELSMLWVLRSWFIYLLLALALSFSSQALMYENVLSRLTWASASSGGFFVLYMKISPNQIRKTQINN